MALPTESGCGGEKNQGTEGARWWLEVGGGGRKGCESEGGGRRGRGSGGGGGGGDEHREEAAAVARGEEMGVSLEDEVAVTTAVRWGLVVSDSGCSCSG